MPPHRRRSHRGRGPRRRGLLVLVAASTLVLAIAQETGTYTLRIRSNLVVLDLLAFDESGAFFESLESADLEVKDDGHTQQIEYFDLVRVGRRTASIDGRLSTLPAGPETTFFASPVETLSIIFALDIGSISHPDLVLVRQAIAEFLASTPLEGVRFMLVSTGLGLRVHVPFTNDPGRLIEEVDRIRMPVSESKRFSFGAFYADVDNLFVSHAANRNFDGLLQTARMATMRAVSFVSELEDQLQRTSGSLGLLASYLRSLPGRKHVVFYSAGYPLEAGDTLRVMIRDRVNAEINSNLSSDQRARLEASMEGLQNKRLFMRLRQPLDQLNRSQVSVYAVDPRGLVTLADDPRRSSRQSNLQTALVGVRSRYTQLDVTAPQDYLVSLASGSGGAVFMNSNDIQRGIRQAVDDGVRYYVLAYRPSEGSRPGKYRRIEVKSRRDGVSLRHREGYVANDDGEIIRGEIYTALSYPELFNNFSFEVDIAPRGRSLEIQTRIPTGLLSFTGDQDRYSCPVETYGVLVNEDGRWVEDRLLFARSHQLELDGADRLHEFRQTDYVSSQSSVAVEPGEYRLVVVVRHGWNAQLGASVHNVTIAP